MIFFKCFAITWMLAWFFILFRMYVKQTIGGRDPFAGLLAIALTWILVGLIPVLIVKFGWQLIR